MNSIQDYIAKTLEHDIWVRTRKVVRIVMYYDYFVMESNSMMKTFYFTQPAESIFNWLENFNG